MKAARQNDPFWDYVEKLDDGGPFKCTFCGYKFSAATSVSRIKWHLSGVKGRGVKICEKVPGDVQDSAREAIDGPPEKKHKAMEGSSNNDLANTISTSAQEQNYEGRLVEMAEQGEDFSPGELEGWMDSITDKEIEFMLGTERAYKNCEGRTSDISSLFMEVNSASNCIENTNIPTGLMQHSERGSSHERLTINQVDTLGDSSRPIDLLCPDLGRRYYQLCSSSLNNDAIMNDVENMIREPGQPFVRDSSREVLQRNGDESRGDAFPTKKLMGGEFENNKNAIWSWIMDDEASSSIGIFGMGGVGKTTLLMHIYNLLLETSNHFCHISWITVSQDFSIYKLQNLIAKDIHLDLSNEDNKWKRAAKLSKALTKKQPWVLIFDDLWNCFDFDEVGIPILLKGCKLIHTTRSKTICQRMDTQHIIKVNPILEEEAWTLFIERLGHDIAPSTEAEDIAKSITKECDGLPLGIITMAGTMKGIDDIHEWRNALEDLRRSRVRQDDMEEEVFRILRFSYSHLKDSELQQCFLYCALFPPDFMIPRKDLVRYLIDEGIIKGLSSRAAEFDKGYSMLNRLENVCLLESAKRYDDRRRVKMHDLIRDMAIQIQQENSQAMVKVKGKMLTRLHTEKIQDKIEQIHDYIFWHSKSNPVDNSSIVYNGSFLIQLDVDATMLACIAFSCPNLEVMEISTSETLVNRITGDELGRFVANKRCLTSLKIDGCSNLGGFVLCSSSLSTIWLSDLYCLSKMVFNCPNLKEISLDFSRQENESTDLTAMVDGLGRTCPRLQNIHVASLRLSHATVLALTAANLRGLRMLSLVLGTEITDASVAAISQSYSKLELLDLSGSSISDSGIGMICNVFPGTLSRFLLAVCPNITSSGIQFATAQLPLLGLLDCGMTICDMSPQNPTYNESGDFELQTKLKNKLHPINQKLIIKHGRLKKLSLWGCSGLDALCLNCPELIDLNLNSCKNMHPERVLLQCPRLESVHASGCQKLLIGAIQSQVSSNDFDASENQFLNKRLADGSKRVRVPLFLSQQPYDEDKKRRRIGSRPCKVLVD